jgi:TPR repeat protein
MFNLGCSLDEGEGTAPPDLTAAADWYRRAADAGDASGAINLSAMYTIGRGKAWQIMRVHFASFRELNNITRRGEHYLPWPWGAVSRVASGGRCSGCE